MRERWGFPREARLGLLLVFIQFGSASRRTRLRERRATTDSIAAWSRRVAARWLVARAVDLHVVGLERVPVAGPAILVARHYHHLYDAAARMSTGERGQRRVQVSAVEADVRSLSLPPTA